MDLGVFGPQFHNWKSTLTASQETFEAADQQADHADRHEGEVVDLELLVARGDRPVRGLSRPPRFGHPTNVINVGDGYSVLQNPFLELSYHFCRIRGFPAYSRTCV